jgi:hypothetical protein
MKGREHSDDLGIDAKIILEWILAKEDGNLWTVRIFMGVK